MKRSSKRVGGCLLLSLSLLVLALSLSLPISQLLDFVTLRSTNQHLKSPASTQQQILPKPRFLFLCLNSISIVTETMALFSNKCFNVVYMKYLSRNWANRFEQCQFLFLEGRSNLFFNWWVSVSFLKLIFL